MYRKQKSVLYMRKNIKNKITDKKVKLGYEVNRSKSRSRNQKS